MSGTRIKANGKMAKGAENVIGTSITNSSVPYPNTKQIVAADPEHVSLLQDGIDRDVRPLLDLADNLRKHGIEENLAIPQIAVFGDQSSGKSSVLEALSGVPFPRGTGLVTRCAIQFKMKRVPNASQWSAKGWLSAGEQPDASGPIASKEDVAGAIERLTAHLNAQSGGFSDTSIIIEVEAPDAPDLTL